MTEIFRQLFTSTFMPHGHCYAWNPGLVWLNVTGDALTAISYFSIPIALIYFLNKRKDIVFNWLFLLFAIFIAACGTTHVMEVVNVWHGAYWLAGGIKLFTAVISFGTAVMLWVIMPQALRIPSPTQFREEQKARVAAEESERKFHVAVESAPNGILVIDEDGRINLVNRQIEEMFGYSRDELVDKPIEILIPERFLQNHEDYRTAYLKDPEKRPMGEGRHLFGRRKDGSEFAVEIALNPIKTKEANQILAAVADITKRQKSEDELKRYSIELERSNRALDEFAHIASHDLKEPLRGIRNIFTFILEDSGDKLDGAVVSRIERAIFLADKLQKLINDLYHFSRLGRGELAVQETDLNEVIDDITQTIVDIYPDKKIEFERTRPLPSITCDRTRITEVFRNLIINAIKYNDSDEVRVEIGYQDSVKNGEIERVFYVKDNGIGIPEELQNEVFRLFRRLHRENDYGGGTGSGLTFVQKIIEQHGGHIWLESRTGIGTTFNFTL